MWWVDPKVFQEKLMFGDVLRVVCDGPFLFSEAADERLGDGRIKPLICGLIMINPKY